MSAALFAAIPAGDVESVATLLAAHHGLAEARDAQGRSAVLVAVYHRQPAILDLLLAQQPTLDLHAAAATGQTVRVQVLLDADAGLLDSVSSDGWTALHLAAFFGRLETAALLLDRGASTTIESQNAMRNTALNAACASNQTEVARLLLQRGAGSNARQAGGFSCLHAAAYNGNVELASLLVAAGADLDAVNDARQTPLDLAMQKGHQVVAELLLKVGAVG